MKKSTPERKLISRSLRRNKFLIAFIGVVGSGKTYIARILARELGAVHVQTDDIRVELRRRGKSYSSAPSIANKKSAKFLSLERSVVQDFDAVLAKRRRELKRVAERFGARAVFVQVKTPEKVIIERLRKKHYTSSDLFKSSGEAIRVYFIRKKLHQKSIRPKADFVIRNAHPLAPQTDKIIRKLKGAYSLVAK